MSTATAEKKVQISDLPPTTPIDAEAEGFGRVIVTDPFEAKAIPNNKQINDYFEAGYELHPEFRSRNRDEAKDLARDLRVNEGKLTAYITLLGGWFGVLVKDAPQKEAKAATAKLSRPEIPVTLEDRTWKSTKEARAYARLLLEMARQAEFDYDVEQAKLRKLAHPATQTES